MSAASRETDSTDYRCLGSPGSGDCHVFSVPGAACRPSVVACPVCGEMATIHFGAQTAPIPPREGMDHG